MVPALNSACSQYWFQTWFQKIWRCVTQTENKRTNRPSRSPGRRGHSGLAAGRVARRGCQAWPARELTSLRGVALALSSAWGEEDGGHDQVEAQNQALEQVQVQHDGGQVCVRGPRSSPSHPRGPRSSPLGPAVAAAAEPCTLWSPGALRGSAPSLRRGGTWSGSGGLPWPPGCGQGCFPS